MSNLVVDAIETLNSTSYVTTVKKLKLLESLCQVAAPEVWAVWSGMSSLINNKEGN